MSSYNTTVFIGRFQPFHLGHKRVIQEALKMSAQMVIIIGSTNRASDIKNPFSYKERRDMIINSLDPQDLAKVKIWGVEDRKYNEERWMADIQEIVSKEVPISNNIAVVGYKKDDSSYYIDKFPQWEYLEIGPVYNELIDATVIRHHWLNGQMAYTKGVLTDYVYKFLSTYKIAKLARELKVIEEGKKRWAGSPYEPIFTTTDAVVIQSGHILMIKRRSAPGEGLLALPGGYLGPKEKIIDSMLRELDEETGIKVPEKVLRGSIVASHIFDEPTRSLRGRIITHAYKILLEDGPLPKLRVPKNETGTGEVSKAQWIPLNELDKLRDQIFEDHPDIIDYFTGRL